jgi:hypothetical protein
MMSLQDNPGRANAAVLMGLLHPGWFYDGKERSVRSDVRLQFVLLLFMMRKVCDGSRNGDERSRSFGKRADVGVYRGKPRGDNRRKAGSFAPNLGH